MKKFIQSTVILLVLSINLNAQIYLEHTFPGYVLMTSTNIEQLYYVTDENIITLYNDDYTLYKTIQIDVPYGYKVYLYANISNHLFNTDDLVEFTLTFKDTLNNSGFLLKLFDENGNELFNFGNSPQGSVHQTINGNLRFYVFGYINYPNPPYHTEIYSLPGYMTSFTELNEFNNHAPYPNPASNYIYLQYQILRTESVNMNIFDSNGQLIEKKRIGGDFNQILLDVSGYESGMYIYRYNDRSGRFIVK